MAGHVYADEPVRTYRRLKLDQRLMLSLLSARKTSFHQNINDCGSRIVPKSEIHASPNEEAEKQWQYSSFNAKKDRSMLYTKQNQCFHRFIFMIKLVGSTHETDDGDEPKKNYRRTQEL